MLSSVLTGINGAPSADRWDRSALLSALHPTRLWGDMNIPRSPIYIPFVLLETYQLLSS